MTAVEIWGIAGSIAACVTAIAAVVAAFIAWEQLSNLNENLRTNNESLQTSNVMAIFEIEFELNRRKERLAEIRHDNEKEFTKMNNKEGSHSENEKALAKMLDGHRKEAYENYLNAFDRLCYFIRKEVLAEKYFHLEYRDMLFNTIEQDPEGKFHGVTPYRNMMKLYNSWKEK